ncbi:MAG: DUF3352 domain-containing protein [Thermoleophilia bacterium]|nr:DUF3352 domain-containing protein [Thermoleophilia bacterium]
MRRFLVAVLALALAAGAAACGGGSAGGAASSSAALVPANTALFALVDTDFDGEQWQAAHALLAKFPDGESALRKALAELERGGNVDFERDVKPALGPELGIAALDLGDDDAAVFLTQPRDPAKLRALVRKGDDPGVAVELEDGWWAAAESQGVLERFEKAREGDRLDGTDAWEDATRDLPEDALVTLYVRGDALVARANAEGGLGAEGDELLSCFFPDGRMPSVGAAVVAEEDGLRLVAGAKAKVEGASNEESSLAGELPGGALAFFSGHGIGEQLRGALRCASDASEDVTRGLAQAELALGVSLDEDLLPLFAGETALAVYPAEGGAQAGAGRPPAAVLLATDVEDEARAREVADRLAARASAFLDGVTVTDVDIAGIRAKRVNVRGEASFFYAVFDGKLVLSSSAEGIEGLRGDGPRLDEDEAFSNARERAGAPDETSGLAYVDVARALRLALASPFGSDLPPDARANLEPLRSLLFWSVRDGDERSRVEGLVGID